MSQLDTEIYLISISEAEKKIYSRFKVFQLKT